MDISRLESNKDLHDKWLKRALETFTQPKTITAKDLNFWFRVDALDIFNHTIDESAKWFEWGGKLMHWSLDRVNWMLIVREYRKEAKKAWRK